MFLNKPKDKPTYSYDSIVYRKPSNLGSGSCALATKTEKMFQHNPKSQSLFTYVRYTNPLRYEDHLWYMRRIKHYQPQLRANPTHMFSSTYIMLKKSK